MKKLLDIPDDIFNTVKSSASDNRRSVNQEIVKMLEYCNSSKEVYDKFCGYNKKSKRAQS